MDQFVLLSRDLLDSATMSTFLVSGLIIAHINRAAKSKKYRQEIQLIRESNECPVELISRRITPTRKTF